MRSRNSGPIGQHRKFSIRSLLSDHSLPIIMISALGVLDFAWNAKVGIVWTVPLWTLLLPCCLFVLSAILAAIAVQDDRSNEVALYLILWTLFPVFGERLTYLAATFDWPLVDTGLARLDRFIGFDWGAWYAVVVSNTMLLYGLTIAYDSYLFQPIAIVIILSLLGPRGRNKEFIVATCTALLITTVFSIALPAYGPNDALGHISAWHPIIDSLRMGLRTPLPYIGVITFPSFHACVAVLYTWTMRGNRVGLMIAGALNMTMLASTLPIGNHYLFDVIGGIGVASVVIWLAPLMIDRWDTQLTRNERDQQNRARSNQNVLPVP